MKTQEKKHHHHRHHFPDPVMPENPQSPQNPNKPLQPADAPMHHPRPDTSRPEDAPPPAITSSVRISMRSRVLR